MDKEIDSLNELQQELYAMIQLKADEDIIKNQKDKIRKKTKRIAEKINKQGTELKNNLDI